MHSCEALIAAFAATQEARYIERTESIAHHITVRKAALCGGGIWEHYRADWTPDPEYNRHDCSNVFRPWGFQPGLFSLAASPSGPNCCACWILPLASDVRSRDL
jgi:mannose/cellobiose epimerase-like protein (N-acyl-D-glucosamine 2-epimerase family)